MNVETPLKLAEQDYQNAMSSKHQLSYKVMNQTGGDEQLIVLQLPISRLKLI